jgi:hypothetical protein
MLKQGLSPMVTLNQSHDSQYQSGGSNNVSDLFNHLVIPNWAFTTPFKKIGGKKMEEYSDEDNDDDDDFISEELHSKLLSMVKVEDNKNSNTKANNKKIKQKTKNFRIKNKNTNNKTKNNK